jgi:hypothetical protein
MFILIIFFSNLNTNSIDLKILGEMYMYNRNNDSSNISQFIKGKIQEEETDTIDDSGSKEEVNSSIKTLDFSTMPSPQNQTTQKVKSDEDFMFQMDKGNLFANLNESIQY